MEYMKDIKQWKWKGKVEKGYAISRIGTVKSYHQWK